MSDYGGEPVPENPPIDRWAKFAEAGTRNICPVSAVVERRNWIGQCIAEEGHDGPHLGLFEWWNFGEKPEEHR